MIFRVEFSTVGREVYEVEAADREAFEAIPVVDYPKPIVQETLDMDLERVYEVKEARS